MANKRIYDLTEVAISDDYLIPMDDAGFGETAVVKASDLKAYCNTDNVPYTGATAALDMGSQNIITTGDITGKKSGVFAYLVSDAVTTVTTGGTYYAIGGTFDNAPIENFTLVGTPAIRYDGTLTQYFSIDFNASFQGGTGKTIKIAISKNGTVQTGSIMGQYVKTSGELFALSGTFVTELETNDEIQLVVTSTSNGDTVNFYYFTVKIREFFD